MVLLGFVIKAFCVLMDTLGKIPLPIPRFMLKLFCGKMLRSNGAIRIVLCFALPQSCIIVNEKRRKEKWVDSLESLQKTTVHWNYFTELTIIHTWERDAAVWLSVEKEDFRGQFTILKTLPFEQNLSVMYRRCKVIWGLDVFRIMSHSLF